MLDRLCDIMTFGALERCSECKTGQLIFRTGGYLCTGDKSEWSKCSTIVKEPKRRPFKVPPECAEGYEFLHKYKYKPGVRVFREVVPKSLPGVVKKEEVDGISK